MEVVNPRKFEGRSEARTNLLLAATLKAAGRAIGCRVRNLSKTGALVETSDAPPSGTTVVIERGELSASGEIVWSANGRCGVQFTSELPIENWVSDSAPVARSVGTGTTNLPPPPLAETKNTQDGSIDARISQELDLVARTLEMVSDILVKDPVLRMRHGMPLQQLSICHQGLTELAQVIAVSDRLTAVEMHVRGPMRQRLLRS